ncbi:LacI family DNA-binding transcriptional regulator [Nonomuraea bangladeshensis]|uniref:LacI family DNA-binding transcriptional regulator n=1 Tax=Nonomuraea bangladeshensis TaxID=404385 RepID=UPI0031D02372
MQDPPAETPSPASPRKRPTIRDVAREAGVSYATVSRVLNGGKFVGEQARRAVEEAVARTGFTANTLARSLATGRSGSYVFLLTEPHQLLFDDPNFAVLLRGVARALSDRRLSLVLMFASNDVEREQLLQYVQGGHVDGVMLVSSRPGDPLLSQLIQTGIPTVACGRVLGYEGVISSVAADDFAGARSVVEHLAATGRRRIAMIAGPPDIGGAVDRLNGYLAALEKHGLPRVDSRIVPGDWSVESGREAMRALLEADPDIDAVFAASDLMASGALTALRHAGRDVPADVAVAGFDDTGLAERVDPPLTTVRQPFDRISEEMVRLICDPEVNRSPLSITVSTSLVVRDSAPY